MKRIFTITIAALFILSANLKLFSQSSTVDDKTYAEKKAEFFKQYQLYKQDLDHNIVSNKPIDPNGLFVIDEHNNFNMKAPVSWNVLNNAFIIKDKGQHGNNVNTAAGYVFSQTTTTYTPIIGGTIICTSGCDDSYHGPYTLPFTFTYNGTGYTQIGVQDNGYICIGTASISGYTPICSGGYANVISPFAYDLYGNGGYDTLRYITLGTTPNRIFVVEWYHWGFYSAALSEIDFQVRLYESSNMIQFVYKPETPTTSETTITCGIMGATNADYNVRTGSSWAASTAGTSDCLYMPFSSTVYPASGLTFSWLPAAPSTPAYYNYNTTTTGNAFPLGVAAGKEVQWLVKAGEFNQPSAAGSGIITSIALMLSSGAVTGTTTFTNFQIKLAQDTITNLPTNTIYTGALQTVFFNPSITFSSTASSWFSMPIMPFTYNSAQSLIVDITQCSATNTNFNAATTTLTGVRRTYITETSCTPSYAGQDATEGNLGINLVSTATPTPMGYDSSTTVMLTPNAIIAPGTINNQIIQIQIKDTGTLNPFIINKFKFETTGSNSPGTDIANAKLYYTRSVNTFATTRQYGSTVTSPNGVFYITDTATLDPSSGSTSPTTNYFWLTYDISSGATLSGDSVMARCDSITGTSPMGGQVPTVTAPPGANFIDYYCRGQFTYSPCPYGFYISNIIFGNINNTPACNGGLPYNYNSFITQSTSVRQNNTYTAYISAPQNPNTVNYATWIDWNNNNSFADANEYYLSTTIAASQTTPSTTSIYIPPAATIASHRMRVRANYSAYSIPSTYYCTSVYYGDQQDYTVVVKADTNMYYVSSTTTRSSVAPVATPSSNTQIIGVTINTEGTISPTSATSFTFNTTGTSHPLQDITYAKLYYTGLSSTFSTGMQLGYVFNPNGTFNFTTSQSLAQGANYFWLTYDVPGTAPAGDTLNAQCTSLTVTGIARTPTVTSPAGLRIIAGVGLCGTYTIPGSYATITAAIADLNAKGTTPNCPVTYLVSANYREIASNLTINATGSSTSPITFKKSGSGANPKIVAAPGTGSYDGIIKLNGVSYITFDGIDVTDTSSNSSTTTGMEYGYALFRPDGNHGCQYITIKNCNITLQKTLGSTVYGIYSYYISIAGTTSTPTSYAGTNSNNSFLSNNISNVTYGYYIFGFYDSYTPFVLMDQNTTISTSGTGARSSVTNFGYNTYSGYGIYAYYQSNITISNTYVNSRGGINGTSYLYGIYNYSYYNGGNCNVIGDTITCADTTSSTGYVYALYNACNYANQVNVLNNVVRDCVNPVTTSYYSYWIYNASGAINYTNSINMSGNKLINNRHGTATYACGLTYNIYNGGGAANSVTITNNLDSGNTVYGTTTYMPYQIYNAGSSQNVRVTNNRAVYDTICGTTAASTSYGLYCSGYGYNITTLDSNYISNNVLPTTVGNAYYGISTSAYCINLDYSYNTVQNIMGTGTGVFYGLYFGASSYLGSTQNINYNNLLNISKTTTTGTGTIYGIYQAGSSQGVLNINNNTINGISSAAATTIYGLYQASSPAFYLNMISNKIGNFTEAGASAIYGIYNAEGNTTTSITVLAQDSVFNLSSTLGAVIYGIYTNSGVYNNIYSNRVLGLTSSGSTTPQVYGMYVSSGTYNYIYNNIISDINAPASTYYSPPYCDGLYLSAGTNNYVYYNTIFLKSTSSGSTFGTACIYQNSAYKIDLRNNVLVNLTTPGASGGYAAAFQRSSYNLATYLTSSNNNCFYAGTPGTYNLLYYDGTYSLQTIAAYRSSLFPAREEASFRELPPFMNASTTPYDLRISTSTGTQLESGGQIISMSSIVPTPINITADAFGTPRYPNAGYPIGTYTPTNPDVGANEFGGINRDTVSPFIAYTALGTGATTNRAFTNVFITDQSSINTTTGTKPRCYYKRSTDGNVINDNTNATDGWKYVESNGTTSPFDFTINYALLNGGTGVTSGQVVQYFVIAQDLATPVNVGVNQASFATYPTSVALTSSYLPTAGSMLSYTIGTSSTSFAGTYYVGTAQTYTALTTATGIFQAINAGTVSGNVTIVITSNTVEDGTNGLNLTTETGVGGYWIRIVPNSATPFVLSGSSSNSSGMIRLVGAKRVVFDGQNGLGSGNYLYMSNLYGTTPTLGFVSDATRDSVKNCNIASNNTTGYSSVGCGTVYFGTAVATGNDSITIAYCNIKDTSGYSTPACGITSNGTVTNINTMNRFNTVTNCNIYNWFLDAGTYCAGINLYTGSADWVINANSFYQTASRTVNNASYFMGIWNNSASPGGYDLIITNNYIGGTAPNCGGSAMTYSGAGAYNYLGIWDYASGYIVSSIQGNTITNMNLTSSPASGSSTYLFNGIRTGYTYSWVNIGNTAGNTIGSATGNGSITLTTNTTASAYTNIYGIYASGYGTLMNNTIGGITLQGNSTGSSDKVVGIYYGNTGIYGATFNITNNLVGSLTTANSLQITNTSDLGNLIYPIAAGTYPGCVLNITNNTVANITSLNASALYLSTINGIYYYYGYGTSSDCIVNITGNTVRNLTTNTNYAGSGTTYQTINGILAYNYVGTTNISNNLVYSLYSLGTTGANQVAGIDNCTLYGMNNPINNNKIYDLKEIGSGSIAPNPNLIGIWAGYSSSYYSPFTIWNNMISITNGDVTEGPLTAKNQPPEKFEQVVVKNLPTAFDISKIPADKLNSVPKTSIEYDKLQGKTIKSENRVPTPKVNDGSLPIGNNNSKLNNPKGLTPGPTGPTSTYNCGIAGIYFWPYYSYSAISTIYYNTIYIGGTQPANGYYFDWDFARMSFGAPLLRNNFFINNRTGGNEFCLSNRGSLTEGWGANTCNYNVYLVSNDNNVGEWGQGNAFNFTAWQAQTGGDNRSWETNTATINPANLLTSISTGDLSINTNNASAWLISGKGIAISGVNTDYFGNTRSQSISTGVTRIGAQEFAATPPNNPVATQVGTPGSGAITNYTLYGRTIATINWGAGGTSYPSSMNIYYYSGVNPPTANGLAPTYSASYWSISPVGSLAGTTYHVTLYFGDNETYTINNPSLNTIVANTNGTFWQAFPQGAFSKQSNITWSTLSSFILDQNITAFSTYALTDGSVVPALLSPINNAVSLPLTDTLTWASVASATNYRVQLANDSLFTSIVLDDSSLVTNSRVVTGLTGTHAYFWRVRAMVPGIVAPFAASYKFTTATGVATLNLNVIPGGFYNSSGQLNMKDTIRILLIDSATGNRIDSIRSIVDSVSFSAAPTPTFSRAVTGKYYIFVFHRNHLPIASKYTQQINRGGTVSYDFTSAATQTYGSNVIQVSTSPVRWGMIPGDANQDQYVDGLDQTIWIAQNGQSGFWSADFNGDGYVDGLDQTIWIGTNGSSSYLPWPITTQPGQPGHVNKDPNFDNRKGANWNIIPQVTTPKNNQGKKNN